MWCHGCAEEFPDGPRVPTFPVTGIVHVDGRPIEMLQVKCEPQFTKPPEVPSTASFTDASGRFALSTFETGDGAPAGKYKLTFVWGQLNMLNGQYGGPDKLGGRYRKPETSPVEVTVDGKPVDLGTIELTTK
jgi:hypothetical protein